MSGGNVLFNFFSDDGFTLGVGNGAARVAGTEVNEFPSGVTPFTNLPIMGALNRNNAATGSQILVNFPAAGAYPFELDYEECDGGQLAITMATGGSTAQGVPPSGALALSPNTLPSSLATNTNQTFSVLATDAGGNPVPNVTVTLLVSGANQLEVTSVTDATGTATLSYSGSNPGSDSVQAIAFLSGMDALSNVVAVQWVGAGSSANSSSPGWIGAPAYGSMVSGVVPITLAAGVTLASGTLSYAPGANLADMVVLNANVSGSGQIGELDTTLLNNGAYWIELQGTDSNGNTQNNLALVTVVGNYKPGRVTATITDFTVPAPGLPIQIQRTYDSLVRSTSSDFGFGWKLGIQVDLVTNPNGDVTFTMNGQRKTFFFTPQGNGIFSYWFLPAYTAEPGFYGSLTTTGDNCSGVLLSMGSTFECAIDNAGLPYQATGYVYTDPYGRVYTIGADGSLQSVQDLSGNTITVTPTGITSSNGLNVPFVRDAQGRITQITDTLGNNYSYAYDASGNLNTVNFPTTGSPVTTTYGYDPTHLLTSEKDPNGHSASSVYNLDGTLQSITDAAGQMTSYTYNKTTNTTVVTNPDRVGTVTTVADAYGMPLMVTDELGRVTTKTYDANHNLLTTTDPLNETTTYTYDANGFRTSKKDALGNTWTTVNNPYGGPTSITDPLNFVQNITYDANFNLSTITDSIGQVAAFTYNAQALPLTMTDARGKNTTYTYDQYGNKLTSTDPLIRTTNYQYNTEGWLTQQTDPRNNVTQYGYDALGRKTSMKDAYNNVAGYGYDANGNKTSETNTRHFTTNYVYDAVNRQTQIRYPDGASKSYTYDFRNHKLTETDQLGRVTKYVYDLAGQITGMTVAYWTADAATTSYTYDLAGRKVTETDPRNNTTTYVYDDAGRMTSMKDAAGNVTQYGYDAKGQRTSMTDAKERVTMYAYDARGRQLSSTFPDHTVASKTYDGMGAVLSATDEDNLSTNYTYDAAGQLIQVKDALGQLTQYGYDNSGNKTSQTDANLHQTTYVYDKLNRRTSRTLPVGQSESMGYDAVGNMTSHTDFNGKNTTLAHDSLNRQLSRTPDASFSATPILFTYTSTGKRASMADPSGTTNYSYTNRDQVLTKATPEGTLSYTYDLSGNVASVVTSNANGTNVAYVWDADNRLQTVTDNRTNGATTYSYDATSQVSSFAYPNGVTQSFGYDLRDRTTSLSLGSIANYVQSFSNSGHKTGVMELSGRAPAYQYDQIWRLTQETIAGDPVSAKNGVLTYMLDPVGNRKSLTSTLAALPNQSSTYDADDRLQSDTYDANGNTLSSGGTNYSYEFEDRLVSTSNGATIVYDGDGNRVSETISGVTTKYLVDDLTPTHYAQVAEETVNGAVTAQFAYGLMRISQNRASAVGYYGYDPGGSVRELLNSAGAVTDTYSYDAFGNTVAQTGSTTNEFLYRGEQWDSALQMYYLRARYYVPRTGRFLTADKWEGEEIWACDCTGRNRRVPLAGAHHRYDYGNADPANHVDPSGQAVIFGYSLTLRQVVGAATIGAIVAVDIYHIFHEDEELLRCLPEQPHIPEEGESYEPSGAECPISGPPVP